ncbi:MAG: peroxiredoxin [Gammaproteobacteria bacterium]|jgi:peroxiredoxin|nr:peroxiredoxin [Gammaproteobacteria bacterium]
MSIKVGDKVPPGKFGIMTEAGPGGITTDELFSGKRVAVFSVPGAFTPTCSARHLPGYVEHAADLKAKGVDDIACFAVNDVFVMNAWGKDQNAGSVKMLADGNGDFTKAIGLELDASGFGMGIRSQRFSMVVNDGVVESLFIEAPGAFEVSSAEHMLENL